MTKPVLGAKRRCLSCGAAFFDLEHDPIVCPRCKAVFTEPPPLPRRPAYKMKLPEPVEPVHSEPVAAPVEDDSEAIERDEEPDDDILPLES